MSGIKNLKYAAKDEYGGSVNLLGATPYMSRKKINVEGPFTSLEEVSIVLNVVFDMEHNPQKLLCVEGMKNDYPEAVEVGREFVSFETLKKNKHLPFEQVYPIIKGALLKQLEL
ncbi:hypothetical protein IMZ31_09585 [Pontibacillus sp. ALD_SL1]|uniref:hypothetical protein n=1 Tax=Pontibacillus sp. ALD_SL1 TaxID=2777185 RepID=UPI001A95F085|nr:hypothetical protein [Pontibacillus sp. ALD_SL1]QSS98374.1 hypothetical protein IMZ31_09585 [Pontibacillus sp. ALD_SL1]